jgi:Chaperone of endosialidase
MEMKENTTMKNPIQQKQTITPHSDSSHRSRRRRRLGLLILSALGCFALGFLALAPTAQAVGPDTDGVIDGINNGEGFGVLVNRTTGTGNTGDGFLALNDLTTGHHNTAVGALALEHNTGGLYNTAAGVQALDRNTTASYNTATGWRALLNNTTGQYNTATGAVALQQNTTGTQNTATGVNALKANQTGFQNTAVGMNALFSNTGGAFTGGSYNTAVGNGALLDNTTGAFNTAVGRSALANNINGVSNIALGSNAGVNVTTASGTISIGAPGANTPNTCAIGQIFGRPSSGGSAVFVNASGILGTSTSSKRFKEEIEPMDKFSEALYALKPVTFRYNKEMDPAGIRQFGLVAEDVEAVNPDLVVRDGGGKVNSVRYDQVNAMLLNEFLREHKKVEEQQATITQLKKEMEMVVAQIKEQTAQIQKVSAQIELSKFATGRIRRGGPASQMVRNNQ